MGERVWIAFMTLYWKCLTKKMCDFGILELLRGISVVNIRINEETEKISMVFCKITFKNRQDLKTAKIVKEIRIT